jgi:outer membrane protein assembly factor BamB
MALAVPGEIWGFDPENGKFLWFCEAIPTQGICTSLVARDGIVYEVVGGQGGGGAAAVRAGGRDDVTKTHVVWSNSKSKSYITSPVLAGDYLYCVNDNGFAICLSSKTGEQIYQTRLPGGGQQQYAYASVVAAGDKIYAVTREKGTFVLAAKPEFEQLAQNQLDGAGICNAGPAISHGRIFLRSDKYLYCIGEKGN